MKNVRYSPRVTEQPLLAVFDVCAARRGFAPRSSSPRWSAGSWLPVFDHLKLRRRFLLHRWSITSHVEDHTEDYRDDPGVDGGGHRRRDAGAAGAGPEGGSESQTCGLGEDGTGRGEGSRDS